MHLYKFIFIKIFYSIILSVLMLFSVLYIFSLIELLSDKYNLLDTIVVGIINTFELLATIPNIIFVSSIIIFSINIKKTNELMIIRHYLSITKFSIIFLIFVILFSNLDINKNNYKNLLSDLKKNYLKSNIKEEIKGKIFFEVEDENITISKFTNIDIEKNKVDNISIYNFKKDLFSNALFSNNNVLKKNQIIIKDPELITSSDIKKLNKNIYIKLDKFGEDFYNTNLSFHKITDNKKQNDSISLLSKLAIFLSLFVYVSIFISRKNIQKSSNNIILIGLCFLIFIYNFFTAQMYLDKHNFIFHFLVVLTLGFYLYKNIIND
ncbi:MAG: hypothetical protein CMI90_02195 [Pelagibacteraceae bacterium]|nr:hypothetical protein [Pelagibacteraceae bacterium]|tara:strand:- start:1565 stop:2530 length:966 start_codon:yes stop_codon:yes gene_type:complete